MNVKFPLIMAVALSIATPALAQGTQQANRPLTNNNGARTPVATQPSNNPFSNPIGQGVPPAASANSSQNSNRTNVPR